MKNTENEKYEVYQIQWFKNWNLYFWLALKIVKINFFWRTVAHLRPRPSRCLRRSRPEWTRSHRTETPGPEAGQTWRLTQRWRTRWGAEGYRRYGSSEGDGSTVENCKLLCRKRPKWRYRIQKILSFLKRLTWDIIPNMLV